MNSPEPAGTASATESGHYRALLQRMFDQMVVRKDASAIPTFYDPDLLLVTNDQQQDYEQFRRDHEGYYATAIEYSIEYDEDSWLEAPDGVGCRMWITTAKPGLAPTRIEVLLIAKYRGDRIHRVWELTYPDWSRLPEFGDSSDTP